MTIESTKLLRRLPQDMVVSAGPLGLVIRPGLGPNDLRHLAATLAGSIRVHSGTNLTLTAWLGDVLAQAGPGCRGLAAACAQATGLNPGTLRNAAMVCRRIPPSRRHDRLTWSHHYEVGLVCSDSGAIERWLSRAAAEQWSARDLRRHLRLYLATGTNAPRLSSPTSHPVFAIMRELRATDRLLANRARLWGTWTTAAAQAALRDLPHFVQFVDRLRAASLQPSQPADPSRN